MTEKTPSSSGPVDPLVLRDKGAVADRRRRAPMVALNDGSLASLRSGTEIHETLREVDVCFVFDTTGSMSDKIDGLKTCITEFVAEMARLALSWRTTCVPFGDLTVHGDRVDGQLPFVDDVTSAQEQIRGLPRFSGGANLGESSIEAMHAGTTKGWRSNAVRVIILLTDEPALDAQRASEIDGQLSQQEIICFVCSVPEQYFQHWASAHGGRWTAISSHMDTGSLLKLLKSLVRDVAAVASEIHAIAGGSVSRYLAMPADKRTALGRGE